MRYDNATLQGFWKTIDDATGQEVLLVVWVDDVTLEYGHWVAGQTIWSPFVEKVTKVTRVHLDHANRIIHVNEAPVPLAVSLDTRKPCTECHQEPTCRRINYCAAYRCNFGEAKKP